MTSLITTLDLNLFLTLSFLQNINIVFFQTLCIVGLGYFLKFKGILNLNDGKSLSRVLMHTTFPALMLVSTAKIQFSFDLLLITLICILDISLMLLIAWFWFKNYDRKMRGVLTMGAGGFNVGLFGFPMIEGLFGKENLPNAVFFDIGNSIMVFMVVYAIGLYFSGTKSTQIKPVQVIKKIIAMPPMLAMVIGILLNLSGFSWPQSVFSFFETLASANKALVLLLMGIYLSFNLKKAHKIAIAKVLTIRYVVAGFVMLILYFTLPHDITYKVLSICVLFPLGLTILPFSDELDYDSEIAGTTVNFSLVISFIAMWLFMLFIGI